MMALWTDGKIGNKALVAPGVPLSAVQDQDTSLIASFSSSLRTGADCSRGAVGRGAVPMAAVPMAAVPSLSTGNAPGRVHALSAKGEPPLALVLAHKGFAICENSSFLNTDSGKKYRN
eukprot:Hpha_TRINITY_DN15964_c1_g5::TRINITY_DN15964_c1_g5_i1::g.73486::m.73486